MKKLELALLFIAFILIDSVGKLFTKSDLS